MVKKSAQTVWRNTFVFALILVIGLSSLQYITCYQPEDVENTLFYYAKDANDIVVNYSFDLTKPKTPFPHFWEQCVGSGHATLALRQDYRNYLTQIHNDCGFTHVRFHGLFDDDMSTYTVIDGRNKTSYFNADSIYDFLQSIGMKPLIELSFMPDLLASGNTTVFHYDANVTPPKSYPDWGMLMKSFAQHLVDRYGLDEVRTWPMEVWNEPNCGFWTGSQQDYFTLYQETVEAIKSVDPLLLVGGPATCQSQWLPEFLNFTQSNNLPVDFVSTHEYPTDIQPVTRDVLTGVTQTARSQVGDLPLYYTEYNDGLYYTPPYHDTPYAAAFAVKNVHDVAPYVDLWSWWTFSDIFEEQGFSSTPFYGQNGWGLMSRYGIPKPSYRAFQLLHGLGDQLVYSTNSTNSTSPLAANLEAYAVEKITEAGKRRVDIVVYNFDVPQSEMANETAVLQVTGVSATAASSGTLNLIDKYHSNPAKKWLEMGKPEYPTKAQLQELLIESYLQPTTITYERISSTTIQFTLNLIPQSVAFISLDLE